MSEDVPQGNDDPKDQAEEEFIKAAWKVVALWEEHDRKYRSDTSPVGKEEDA